jgi:hypothetical protein
MGADASQSDAKLLSALYERDAGVKKRFSEERITE